MLDNNILTDFMELTAAAEYNYISILNQLFSEVVIPTPVLDDENIYDSLGELEYKEGVFEAELGFGIFMELGNSGDKMAKKLSEYDRHLTSSPPVPIVTNEDSLKELTRLSAD